MAPITDVNFHQGLTKSDPEQIPVLFVGTTKHISSLKYQDVECKVKPYLSEQAWNRGVQCATTSCSELVEVWPRGVWIGCLPLRRSRHNAACRPYALTKLVQRADVQHIVLICRKQDLLGSCVAICRACPVYSAKSSSSLLNAQPSSNSGGSNSKDITVQILLATTDENDGTYDDEVVYDQYLLDDVLTQSDLDVIKYICDGIRLAAKISDMPTNLMNVDQFIEEAIKITEALNIRPPTIIRGEQLKEKGLGGIYGVGAASACPPALVVLSHVVDSEAEHVAWVGKGIVYDTGGLCIKGRTSMVGMKRDCAGAAGVLGAFYAAVKSGISVNLHAVLCLAENSVGPKATRPDDIHCLYSGRTVEINNTDAEGRLVLADGVVYAQRDLKATTIVDMATLTGAQGTATGKYHAAIICNNARLERECIHAGMMSADMVHPLPYTPELHFTEFSSTVADMKNSVADRANAQPSCAGLFIMANLGFDFNGSWLHIDMASPAIIGERGTGYGVALLPVLFGNHTKSKLLNSLSNKHK